MMRYQNDRFRTASTIVLSSRQVDGVEFQVYSIDEPRTVLIPGEVCHVSDQLSRARCRFKAGSSNMGIATLGGNASARTVVEIFRHQILAIMNSCHVCISHHATLESCALENTSMIDILSRGSHDLQKKSAGTQIASCLKYHHLLTFNR